MREQEDGAQGIVPAGEPEFDERMCEAIKQHVWACIRCWAQGFVIDCAGTED